MSKSDNWNNEAATYIREWRRRNKKSQAELAAMIGYHARTIKTWEAGVNVPKLDIFVTLEGLELKMQIQKIIDEFNEREKNYVVSYPKLDIFVTLEGLELKMQIQKIIDEFNEREKNYVVS